MSETSDQLYYRIEDLFFAADHLAGVARDLGREIKDPEVKAVVYRAKVNFASTARALEKIVKEGLEDVDRS